jgi:ABC-type antimicrobial peptide transport system permease subunit
MRLRRFLDVTKDVAYAAGRSMQSVLFGVNPADAIAFAAAIIVCVLMTIAGSLLPAWRAVKVDPITATRTE